MLGAIEQGLRADDVGGRERCRVSKIRIDVFLRGGMDHAVDVVSVDTIGDVLGRNDVTLVEREVLTAIQHFVVGQGGAKIELVERGQVVMALIGDSQGSDDPRTSVRSLSVSSTFLARTSRTAGDGDRFRIYRDTSTIPENIATNYHEISNV